MQARRILAMDSLRENIHRDVIPLVLNGQRVQAIRIYQRLVSLLKLELDVEPGACDEETP
jgi:DNA-binding SARP family transcriptional activator